MTVLLLHVARPTKYKIAVHVMENLRMTIRYEERHILFENMENSQLAAPQEGERGQVPGALEAQVDASCQPHDYDCYLVIQECNISYECIQGQEVS